MPSTHHSLTRNQNSTRKKSKNQNKPLLLSLPNPFKNLLPSNPPPTNRSTAKSPSIVKPRDWPIFFLQLFTTRSSFVAVPIRHCPCLPAPPSLIVCLACTYHFFWRGQDPKYAVKAQRVESSLSDLGPSSVNDERTGSEDCCCWGPVSGLFGLWRVLSKDSIGRLPSGISKSDTSSAARFIPARIVRTSAAARSCAAVGAWVFCPLLSSWEGSIFSVM